MNHRHLLLAAAVIFAGCGESPTQLSDDLEPAFGRALGHQVVSGSEAFTLAAWLPIAGAFPGWQETAWVPSGIVLQDGIEYVVTAGGLASCGVPGKCLTGPDGQATFDGHPPSSFPSLLVPSGPFFALFARVNGGDPILVGSGPTVVTGSGELSFAYNDTPHYTDNTGGYNITVDYSYECKPGKGKGDQNHLHCGPPGPNR